jgi:16S rRNA (guanine527-N7)-methyltransferase
MAEAYVALLATAGTERGLLGPREVPRLWDRHVLNCAVVTDLVPEGRSVADIGSGAGLPGLALAIRRPDLEVTLVEPLLRRAQFLEEAVTTLGLASVTVWRARAEELVAADGPGPTFDVVTSRALAPLPRLLEWSLPLTSATGELLAIKGRNATAEIEEMALPEEARRLVEVVEVGRPELVVPTTVVRVDSALRRHIGLNRSRGGVRHRHPGSRQRRRR